MGDEIDVLIDDVTVDAYGVDEQLWAFRQAFEDEARFPFPGQVVGVDVEVESIDYGGRSAGVSSPVADAISRCT